ncbi:hypothetical protein CALCODRAFT_230719 [Calocera cornea HHB12733]|uniref:Uncharacterized protein n=1 Tax=Calocera cornea HHB12733 TaxID=1353952 RepID=A0A165GZF3_9BASI|nr:hypothetical protein CALCODRAFT_230719 [Calocera cornea HHB12733]
MHPCAALRVSTVLYAGWTSEQEQQEQRTGSGMTHRPEKLCKHALRLALRVHIGRVERVDAPIPGHLDNWKRLAQSSIIVNVAHAVGEKDGAGPRRRLSPTPSARVISPGLGRRAREAGYERPIPSCQRPSCPVWARRRAARSGRGGGMLLGAGSRSSERGWNNGSRWTSNEVQSALE